MKFIRLNGRYKQLFVALIACLTLSSHGMLNTWSSPVLPELTSEDSPLGYKISEEEASWIVSSFVLGHIFGAFVSGILLDTFGAKTTLLISTFPMTLSWFVSAFVKSGWVIVGFRIFAGTGGCITITAAMLYVSEIAEKDIRGMLVAYMMVMKQIGVVYILCVGPYLPYRILTLSCSVFLLVFYALFFIMPESPYYLIKRGKHELARASIESISRRDATKDFIGERLQEIQKNVEDDEKKPDKTSYWTFLTLNECRKPIILMIGIKTLQQFSGKNTIDAYLQTIFTASESTLSPQLSSLICGTLQIPAALLGTLLVDGMGRKPLMICSALFSAIGLIAEGTFFYLKLEIGTDMSAFQWLPTTALGIFLVTNPPGLFLVSYVLAGELFSMETKNRANALISTYTAILAFLVLKFFGPISTAWGMYTMFWIFAGSCIIGAIGVFIFVPETKGKSFNEIQEKLKRRYQ